MRYRMFLFFIGLIGLLLTSCSQEPLTKEELEEKAAQAVEQGSYSEAIIYYRNLISQEDAAIHRIALAKAYLRVNNFNGATKELIKAKELKASFHDWAVPLGVSWMTLNEWQKLEREIVSQNYRYEDEKAEALAFAAWIDLRLGKLSSAEQKIAKASELFEKSDLVRFVSALTLMQRNQLAEALANLVAIEHYALLPEKAVQRANILINQGKLDDAKTILTEAQNEFPYEPRILTKLTNLYIASRDASKVEEQLKKLEKYFPNSLYQHLLSGKWLFVNGEHLMAKDELQKAAAIYPGHPEVNMFIGLVFAELSQWDQAANYLHKTLERYPSHLQTAQALTKVYLIGLKQPKKAVELLTGIQDEHKNQLSFHLHYIDALMADKQYDAAIQRMNQIRQFNPNLKVIDLSHAIAQYRLGQTEEALERLSETSKEQELSVPSKILLAKIRLSQNQLAEAKVQLDELLASDSNNPAVLELAAQYALAEGKTDEATQRIEKLLAERPKMKSAWILLAGIASTQGNIPMLEDIAARMEKEFLEDPDVDMVKLEIETQKGNRTAAVALMEKVWEADKSKVEVAKQLINLHLINKPYYSEQIARQMVTFNANQADSHYQLGKALLRLRKLNDASKSINRALSLNQEHLPALFTRIEILKAERKFADASDQFERLYLKNANHPLVLESYIRFLGQSGQVEKAMTLVEKIDDLKRQMLVKAELSFLTKDYSNALSIIQTAKKQGLTTELVVLESKVHDASGNTKQAIDVLSNWLTSNPDDHQAILALADFRVQTNSPKNAIEGYRTLLKLYPKNLLLLNNLAWAYLEAGDQQNALHYARELNALTPELPAFIDTVAWIEINYGQIDDGIRALETLIQQDIDFPEAVYHLAYGYQKSDQNQKAKELLEALIAKKPEKQLNDKAEGLLKRL